MEGFVPFRWPQKRGDPTGSADARLPIPIRRRAQNASATHLTRGVVEPTDALVMRSLRACSGDGTLYMAPDGAMGETATGPPGR